MSKNFSKTKRACPARGGGFTIIEMMIAISLFLVIVMEGMGALLNANLVQQKSQDMRSIMDSLSFIMEDMSRNLRTGSHYSCINGTSSPSGSDCKGISFDASDGSRWIYTIEYTNGGTPINIKKSVAGATPVQLTPDEVNIDLASGFSVLGAELPPSDKQQPLVTIKLFGTITSKNVTTPFSLQTSVSQRLLDNIP